MGNQLTTTDNLRGYFYRGDNMRPLIDLDCSVIIKPILFYDAQGVYLIHDGGDVIYRCERQMRDVLLISDNPAYTTQKVTLEWFDEHVTGQILSVTREIAKV